jgi:hypothetical protein
MPDPQDDHNVLFRALPATAFPFTVCAYLADGTIVWEETVTGPGALKIPALAQRHGEPVHIKVTYADGETRTAQGIRAKGRNDGR